MLFYAYIENNEDSSQKILFYAAIVGLLRAQMFMIDLFDILFNYENVGPRRLRRRKGQWSVGINLYARSASCFYTMIITIFFLVNMNSLFQKVKTQGLLTKLVGFFSSFLFIANFIFHLIVLRSNMAQFLVVYFKQITIILIMVTYIFTNNKLYDDRQEDMVEKIKQNQKFESCFDNVKESIILI